MRAARARPVDTIRQGVSRGCGAVTKSAYVPKLVTVLREGYSARTRRADAIAGLNVAIVALPLALALGIAGGAPPRTALDLTVVAGSMLSPLGGFPDPGGG